MPIKTMGKKASIEDPEEPQSTVSTEETLSWLTTAMETNTKIKLPYND